MDIEILNENGQVINTIVADEEFSEQYFPGHWRVRRIPDLEKQLQDAINEKVAEIKAEAERRISALDWRLQRAQEREQLGEAGFETVSDVLTLREQIRQASNAAELAVADLKDVYSVMAFAW